MNEVAIVGVDLSKNAFQLHGADAKGYVVFRKQVTRTGFRKVLERLPKCIITMEACASSHYWGREVSKLGHEARLITPIFVKPFVQRQKNDVNDVFGIAEVISRPTMRYVAVKSEAQQARSMVFRTRELVVRQRTQMINALRGHLAEHGIVMPKGSLH